VSDKPNANWLQGVPLPKAAKPGVRPHATVNIRRILADAGGADALIAAHRDFGFEPLTLIQVKNWRKRHTIPTERLAEILIAMRSLCGPGVDVFDYLHVSEKTRQ
jgi:hypothetical protein